MGRRMARPSHFNVMNMMELARNIGADGLSVAFRPLIGPLPPCVAEHAVYVVHRPLLFPPHPDAGR
jgi:hypothetical protein